jgi:hypothetical protein
VTVLMVDGKSKGNTDPGALVLHLQGDAAEMVR